MDFPTFCEDLGAKPEDCVLPLEQLQENPMILRDRTELDHMQRFIGFCNENRRAPLSYSDLEALTIEILEFGPGEL